MFLPFVSFAACFWGSLTSFREVFSSRHLFQRLFNFWNAYACFFRIFKGNSEKGRKGIFFFVFFTWLNSAKLCAIIFRFVYLAMMIFSLKFFAPRRKTQLKVVRLSKVIFIDCLVTEKRKSYGNRVVYVAKVNTLVSFLGIAWSSLEHQDLN